MSRYDAYEVIKAKTSTEAMAKTKFQPGLIGIITDVVVSPASLESWSVLPTFRLLTVKELDEMRKE